MLLLLLYFQQFILFIYLFIHLFYIRLSVYAINNAVAHFDTSTTSNQTTLVSCVFSLCKIDIKGKHESLRQYLLAVPI